MGIVVRLLCISLLVGICLAVNGSPQQQSQAALEPRMTELSKLSQQIKNAAQKHDPTDDMEDCHEPPPRRCRWYGQHDPSDPNSPGWVRANVVGMGQLPDDVKAKLPKWIPARTVPFLPEEASTGEAGSPCCICPQCGLSFYTPNDYWGHIPTCPVPGPRPCIQTNPCLGNSHFDADPRVCMCRPGPAPSSSTAAAATGVTADSSSSSTVWLPGSTGVDVNATLASSAAPVVLSSSSELPPPAPVNGSLIMATGSIGEPLTGGAAPFMLEYPDIKEIGEEVGKQVAEAIQAGTDDVLLGS